MAGLDLGIGAQARGGVQARAGSMPAPTTASEAAFGSANSVADARAGLMPTQPAGAAVVIGLLGVGLLAFVYWSLPGR